MENTQWVTWFLGTGDLGSVSLYKVCRELCCALRLRSFAGGCRIYFWAHLHGKPLPRNLNSFIYTLNHRLPKSTHMITGFPASDGREAENQRWKPQSFYTLISTVQCYHFSCMLAFVITKPVVLVIHQMGLLNSRNNGVPEGHLKAYLTDRSLDSFVRLRQEDQMSEPYLGNWLIYYEHVSK